MYLFNVRVYQRLQAISFTFNTELSTSIQSCSREQNEFCECQDAVAFNDSGSSLCFAYLPGNNLWRVEKIDLAVLRFLVSPLTDVE
jgi:hypothetical protein